jgi:CheY-like chemotaxis protein
MSELANRMPLRVLVVDDCVDTADSLAALLGLWGYLPTVAYDGWAALAAGVAQPPDVVLLDLALPGLDGFEVARRLRQEQGLPRALVVAISGYGDDSFRLRADEAGIDLYLIKPFDLEWLRRLLTEHQEARGPLPTGELEKPRSPNVAPGLPTTKAAPGTAFGL